MKTHGAGSRTAVSESGPVWKDCPCLRVSGAAGATHDLHTRKLNEMNDIDTIVHRAIDESSTRAAGPLTEPRTYGVYRLPASAGATRRVRYGNHPVRKRELEKEFGMKCPLVHLFRSRDDAKTVSDALNDAHR